MAKMVLGKTPQELEAEKAKRARELEAEIQQSSMERQRKIQALHKAQIRNKIIIGFIAFVLIAILVTFGTYNTFFKKGLTIDDVNYAIAANTQQTKFPSEGLDNYVRDNCTALFNKYMTLDNKRAKNIASVEVDANSCNILKVRKLNATLAEVYFAVDVKVTEKDSIVTDPVIIDQLKRSGFGVIPDANTTTLTVNKKKDSEITAEQKTAEEDVSTNSVEEPDLDNLPPITAETVPDSVTGVDESATATTDNNEAVLNGEETDGENTDVTAEEQPVIETEVVEEETDIPITDIDYSDSLSGETNHYYMTANGTVWQSGKVTVARYNFYLPIEFKYSYDTDGTIMYAGYNVAGNMNLYSLVEENQTDFEEITTNAIYTFNEDTLVDESTQHDIQIRVDRFLDDVYAYKDTSQEYKLYLSFNTYDASYNGIEEISSYKEPNQMGYNTKVTYKITTPQGFSYTLKTLMTVEPNGTSWVITKIM